MKRQGIGADDNLSLKGSIEEEPLMTLGRIKTTDERQNVPLVNPRHD